jgi:hypothetical protein
MEKAEEKQWKKNLKKRSNVGKTIKKLEMKRYPKMRIREEEVD